MSAFWNHPGWGKGAKVLVANSLLAEVITDGVYIDTGYSGLWHYTIRFENGTERVHIPKINDVLLKRVDRWRPEHVRN